MSVLGSQGGGQQWTIRQGTIARSSRGRSFSVIFKDLTDARQQAKVVYPLDEVLLLATLAGAETVTDITRFGEKKLALLRRFRPFKDGTPPHDRVGDIFATLDAEQFQRRLVAWVASVTGLSEGVIAIDGKTVRRSGRKKTTRHRST